MALGPRGRVDPVRITRRLVGDLLACVTEMVFWCVMLPVILLCWVVGVLTRLTDGDR
jgi:hypothetical protein